MHENEGYANTVRLGKQRVSGERTANTWEIITVHIVYSSVGKVCKKMYEKKQLTSTLLVADR